MRRFMWMSSLVVLGVAVMSVAVGCNCCGFQKVPHEALVENEAPPPPAPVVSEAPRPLPTPEPIRAPVPPPITAPVPPAVAAAIEDVVQKYPGLFTFDATKGLFHFSADITFDSGSFVVKPQAKEALTKVAAILAGDAVKDRNLPIIGHTDTDRVVKPMTITHLKAAGKSANNQGLSEARAEAVAAVLQAGGVEASRMSTRGAGQNEPVADNKTAAGKARNRRVDIYLTPIAGASTGG
jgi:outer membrane protein OmpA-like peptidoglycan-associated protein